MKPYTGIHKDHEERRHMLEAAASVLAVTALAAFVGFLLGLGYGWHKWAPKPVAVADSAYQDNSYIKKPMTRDQGK